MSSTNARVHRNRRRGLIAVIIAAAVILSAVIAALSQRSPNEPERKVVEVKRISDPPKKRPSRTITRSSDGNTVVRDDATGQTRDLTPEEQRRLAAGLTRLINKSMDGLIQTTYDDGTVTIDMADHYQNVMMAKVESDGSVTTACSDDIDAAAAFFKIDPAIIEAAKQRAATRRVRSRTIE